MTRIGAFRAPARGNRKEEEAAGRAAGSPFGTGLRPRGAGAGRDGPGRRRIRGRRSEACDPGVLKPPVAALFSLRPFESPTAVRPQNEPALAPDRRRPACRRPRDERKRSISAPTAGIWGRRSSGDSVANRMTSRSAPAENGGEAARLVERIGQEGGIGGSCARRERRCSGRFMRRPGGQGNSRLSPAGSSGGVCVTLSPAAWGVILSRKRSHPARLHDRHAPSAAAAARRRAGANTSPTTTRWCASMRSSISSSTAGRRAARLSVRAGSRPISCRPAAPARLRRADRRQWRCSRMAAGASRAAHRLAGLESADGPSTIWTGTEWRRLQPAQRPRRGRWGVNATADETNGLAVSMEAGLLG